MAANKREMMAKIEASQARMMAKMEAIDAKRRARERKMEADTREMTATIKSDQDEMIKAQACREATEFCLEKTMALPETTEACEEKTMALPETTEACPVKTRAFLEKKEPTPEEAQAVAKPQEVPEGATGEETIGAAKDRSRDPGLAVGCRGQLKPRTKRDGRLRQEYASTVGQPTRPAVPAMRKGALRKGPGKKCRSGLRGQNKASRNGKGGRIVKRDQQPAVGYRSPVKRQTKNKVV
jgi:hypothetical protein